MKYRCEVCGKAIVPKTRYYVPKCCSKDCRTELHKQKIKRECTCRFCGKKFVGGNTAANICPDAHYKDCVICGQPILLDKYGEGPQTCSQKCRTALVANNFR